MTTSSSRSFLSTHIFFSHSYPSLLLHDGNMINLQQLKANAHIIILFTPLEFSLTEPAKVLLCQSHTQSSQSSTSVPTRPFRDWQMNLLKKKVRLTSSWESSVVKSSSSPRKSRNRRNHITAQLSSRQRSLQLGPAHPITVRSHFKMWKCNYPCYFTSHSLAITLSLRCFLLRIVSRSSRADCRRFLRARSVLFPSPSPACTFDELSAQQQQKDDDDRERRNMRVKLWWACRVILMSTIKWHFNGETITDIYINKSSVQQSPHHSNSRVDVFSWIDSFCCCCVLLRSANWWNSWNILSLFSFSLSSSHFDSYSFSHKMSLKCQRLRAQRRYIWESCVKAISYEDH